MNKVKKFISVVLCIALLSGVGVQQVFAEGKISNVEQNEEVVLDDQNVKDNNEVTGENLEDVSKENSDIGDSEISQEDNEKQEQIEISNAIITNTLVLSIFIVLGLMQQR